MRMSYAVAKTGKYLNSRILKRMGLQLVRPVVIHGPPATIGVVEWSKRLWGFERFLSMLADVPGDFVECGVFWGQGLLILSHLNQVEGRNRCIRGFDSFQGHPSAASEDLRTPESETLGDMWRVTEQDVWKTLMLGTGLDESTLRATVKIVPGWFSDTLKSFEGQIALMHLDPDYYESTRDALTLWPKVSRGGGYVWAVGQFETAGEGSGNKGVFGSRT